MKFLAYLVSGISLGSIYAIIALGYTMVYGIAKMLNFAHGDVIMVGGYISYIAASNLGLPPLISVLLAMAVCTLQLFGGQLSISYVSLLTVACCIVIMVGLTLFTGRTRMGKAMRACSEDKGAAQLMGINVNRTISLTFAIGSALAAVAGALLCSFSPTLMPTTGSMPGIKAFTAAVFGGIGSIPGAFLGGILLGVIESLAKAYISTQLSNSIVFAVLIVILLVRPAGLLGKRTQEKV